MGAAIYGFTFAFLMMLNASQAQSLWLIVADWVAAIYLVVMSTVSGIIWSKSRA